jgi:hypothetical protein
MADTNPFPRTVASITREGRGPQTHAYDAPNLSAKEFMLAVMHDPSVDIRERIKAAASLLRIFGEHEFYPPRIKYIIGGILPCHLLSRTKGHEFVPLPPCSLALASSIF